MLMNAVFKKSRMKILALQLLKVIPTCEFNIMVDVGPYHYRGNHFKHLTKLRPPVFLNFQRDIETKIKTRKKTTILKASMNA